MLTQTDVQQLINDAIFLNGQGRRQGTTVFLPSETINVYDTILVENVYDLKLVGSGMTKFIWYGPANKPVIRFAKTASCVLERVEIINYSVESLAAIEITNTAGPSDWITTACRFTDITIPHTGTNGFKYGLHINSYAGGGNDGNNEHHIFERVTINNYTDSAVYIYGGQIHQLRFNDCHFFDHGGRAKYGIYGHYGNYWFWNGGSMSAHSEADFYIYDFVTRCEIRNFNGESSRRFLATGGPTGAPLALTIDGLRWDGRPLDGDNVITYLSPGPLNIHNSLFMSQLGTPCKILVYPPAGMIGGSLSMKNVILGQFGGTTAPLEAPVKFGDGQEIEQFGLQYRWINPPPEHVEENIFRLKWEPNLNRLPATINETFPTVFDGSFSDVPAADITNNDFCRGWTVYCEALVQDGTEHPHIWALQSLANDLGMKVWYLGRHQWRLESTGMCIDIPHIPGTLYKILASYNNDNKTVCFRINDIELEYLIYNYSLPSRLSLGNWPTGVDNLRFNGEIHNVKMWTRPLYKEERKQLYGV